MQAAYGTVLRHPGGSHAAPALVPERGGRPVAVEVARDDHPASAVVQASRDAATTRMLWKEMHASRASGLVRVVLRFLGLLLFLVIAWSTYVWFRPGDG